MQTHNRFTETRLYGLRIRRGSLPTFSHKWFYSVRFVLCTAPAVIHSTLRKIDIFALNSFTMKIAWQTLSVLSHPLLIVTYGLVLMLASNPFIFGSSSLTGHLPFIMIVGFSTVVIPGLAVFMMRRLNMISSFAMPDRKERVGPLFASCILYAAFYFNVQRSNAMPTEFGNFLLGSLISLFCCLFINSFYKISLHAVGLSGLVMGMFIYYFSGAAGAIDFHVGNQIMSFHFILVPIILLIMLGLVSTGRLELKAHKLDEVLAGWMVGVLGQVVAALL